MDRMELKELMPNFKLIWSKLSEDERHHFIKIAKLDHIVKLNNPEWNQIETQFQQKIPDEIRTNLEKCN